MFMVSVFGSWVLAFDGGFWGCLLLEYTWVYLGFSAFDVCLWCKDGWVMSYELSYTVVAC